ncbi:MAG: hypothetical protein JRG96_19865 [Deltaproteobacteria bacterium]|nr:hypothetical protein [Deltaproteobacteria bacterium]MBW2419644.1 hypothetical protein [Deltaproteobacteria bacterium]
MRETLEQRFGELQLAYPATWEAELISDMNGLLLVDPQIEQDWQASVFLELLRDDEDRPIDVAMADLLEAQQEEHAGFHLRRRELREHVSGHPFGLIEFDSLTDGMPLTQWLAVLATSGRERLFVTAASERSLWAKYEPVFDAVMSSIRRADL